ncbi:hypothetical protein [Liquorilactobacillus vini]|nr:hypothetical protein [Liquorilactobacillus vini]
MKIDPEKFALAIINSSSADLSLDAKLYLYQYAYEKAAKLELNAADRQTLAK